METWHKRLAQAVRDRGKTQADLARVTGKKPPSVNGWFTGETKMMEADSSAKVCSYLRINALWLFHKMGPSGLEEPETELTKTVNPVRKPENKYVTEPLQEYDELRRQLLYFFDGMNESHKDALVMMANGLYSMDNPNDRTAQPFVYPWAGQERRKGVLYGEVDLSGVRKNVHKDNGVPKQANNPDIGRPATHGKKKTA